MNTNEATDPGAGDAVGDDQLMDGIYDTPMRPALRGAWRKLAQRNRVIAATA
jgi:hypothetical protein